jgi:glycosyltransferase involved in cell wall biosynthesis
MANKKKLAVVATHPIQYQAPLWRFLAQYPELDLWVYFGSDFSVRGSWDAGFNTRFAWDVPLTEGYSHTFLATNPNINQPADLQLHLGEFRRRLSEFQPDCLLLTGYTPLVFSLKVLLAARRLGIPLLLRADATDEAVDRGAAKAALRYLFLRVLYTQMDRFLAVGHNARRHYLSKGVPANKIYFSPFNIDSGLLARQEQELSPQRAEIRKELGFGDVDFVFLFSGKLIPKKDPLTIAQGFGSLRQIHDAPWGLVVMGDGRLRGQFEAAMAAIPGMKTTFVGFQNQSRVGRFYSAADCLLLPSRWGETWGLVVNEALQFGLPALVSDRVGCRHDLIQEGETGLVFPVGDAQALAEKMARVRELMATRGPEVRAACRQKAREYSLERAAAGIREAVLSL